MTTHRRVRPVVVENLEDTISVVALDETGEPLTVTSATVAIYAPEGGELVSATAAAVSSPVCSLTRVWTESLTPIDNGYRARWVFTHAGGTKTQDTFFDVVVRRLESQLLDTDITARHPYLSGYLPAGVSGFSVWRMKAWRTVEQSLRQAFAANPGRAFYPQKFFDVHLDLTVAEFLRDAAVFATGSVDTQLADFYQSRGLKELDLQLSDIAVDTNDDNEMEDSEEHLSLTGVELFR